MGRMWTCERRRRERWVVLILFFGVALGKEWDGSRPLDPNLKLDSLRALQQILTELEPAIETRRSSKSKYTRLPPTPSARYSQRLYTEAPLEENTHVEIAASDNGIMAASYRIAAVAIASCALAYLSVWPRTLERAAYNEAYKATLERLVLAALGPILLLAIVFDGRKTTLRDATAPLARAFFIGAPTAALIEAVLNFASRSLAFSGRMADIEAPPRTPTSVRVLFCLQFVSGCILAPFIEEFCKLRAAVGSRWKSTYLHASEMKSPSILVHSALTRCISAAVGFKLADTFRRVALYSRPWHPQQRFFAAARGLFPIHELCAALVAPRLLQAIILDKEDPRRKHNIVHILFPAILLHASANFRGMKPLSAWSADTPWLELQLQAWNAPDDATPLQLLTKSSYALLWWSLLCKVLAFAAKQYYEVAARPPMKYNAAQKMQAPPASIHSQSKSIPDQPPAFHTSSHSQRRRPTTTVQRHSPQQDQTAVTTQKYSPLSHSATIAAATAKENHAYTLASPPSTPIIGTAPRVARRPQSDTEREDEAAGTSSGVSPLR